MTEPVSTISVEIAKLALQPGDFLVVKCDATISLETAERAKNYFAELLPDDVKIIVIDKDISLAILTRTEIEARAA